MPKFEALERHEVVLGSGRARTTPEELAMYRDALTNSDAGRIEVDVDEPGSRIKRLLTQTAKDMGIKIRTSWQDPKTKQVLEWAKR